MRALPTSGSRLASGACRISVLLLAIAPSTIVRAATPEDVGWHVSVDPPAPDSPRIPEKLSDLAIPVPTGRPLYPAGASPFVAVGQNRDDNDVREVWDLRSRTKVGTVRGKAGSAVKDIFRLSPDGKRLAARAGEGFQNPHLEIWSFETGKKLREIEPKPKAKTLDVFDFVGPDEIVLVDETDKDNFIQLVEVESGKTLWSRPAPDGSVPATLAQSPGRKYLALLAKKRVEVLEAASGKTVGALDGPQGLGAALRFSPDGSELAGLYYESPGGRLMAWDVAKGTVVVDHRMLAAPTFPVGGQFAGGPAIDWLPDGSAWLLADHALVDREEGRWTWTLLSVRNGYNSLWPKLIDNDHALVSVGKQQFGPKRLEVITLPWPQIDASLKAMKSGAPALLRPGDEITLSINVGPLRGSNPQDVQAALTKALTACLESQGFHVASGRPVVLHVSHKEEEHGQPLHMRRLGERFDPRSPSGPALHATRFTDEVALKVPGSAKPAWSVTLVASYAPFGLVRGEVTDKSMRDGGFETHLQKEIGGMALPYFIPKDPGLATLPGLTIPTPSSAIPSGTATPRATTRGRSR